MLVAKKFTLPLNVGLLVNSMLIDVLTRVAADTGIDAVQQRSLLLRHIQNAASEMHKQLECTKILREVSLIVPKDAVVALPYFVGELRGMRMHTNDIPFNLHPIGNPRYTNDTWQYKFKNWRDLGESAIKLSLNSVSPLTLIVNAIEDPVVEILIAGQTANSERIEEVIELDATSKTTTNSFGLGIFAIACNTTRTYNVIIHDSDGNEIAILYNNQRKTRYKLVDVSKMFWSLDTIDGQTVIDVLYKEPLPLYANDTDVFPAGDDYDDAWYFMAMHFFFKPLPDKQEQAGSFRSQSEAAMITAESGDKEGQLKKMTFGRNKYYGHFRKYETYYPGATPTNVDSAGQ